MQVIQTEQFSTTLTTLTEHSNVAQLKELSSISYIQTHRSVHRDMEHGTHTYIHILNANKQYFYHIKSNTC